MWKVFPKLGLLKAVLFLFSAIYFGLLLIYFDKPFGVGAVNIDDFKKALSVSTPATLIFMAIIFFVGKVGWLLFWRMPFLGPVLNKNVCPDLNGTWSGVVESNFEGSSLENVEMEIKCNLFGFDVNLKSIDEYQRSVVVQSDIYRDPRTYLFYLSYIFQAIVPFPEDTDDRTFEGAAILEIQIDQYRSTLSGTYWTNRAWQRKRNTAGRIRLSRS